LAIHTAEKGGKLAKSENWAGINKMDHLKLVLPEYLNDQGFLFGGYLLKWIDEVAYITARLDYPGHTFVTVSLDSLEFKHRIQQGQILRLEVQLERQGNSSVKYAVEVVDAGEQQGQILFQTHIALVSVDGDGRPQSLRV
jgi:acyl-CoA hydrolase